NLRVDRSDEGSFYRSIPSASEKPWSGNLFNPSVLQSHLDEARPPPYLYFTRRPSGWPWISCRVAERSALRRHGNRTGIIYRGRQVPTLDPESTGDMRFGMRKFLFQHS